MIQLADAVPAWCADANPIDVTEVVVADSDHSVRVALLGCSNYSRTGLRAQPVAFDDVPSFDGRAGKPTFAGVGVTVLASTRHPKLATTAAAMLAGAEAQVGLSTFGGGELGNRRASRNDQATATTRGLFRNTLRSLDRIELQPTSHPPSPRRPSDLFRGVRAGVHPSERRTHGDEGRHCAAYGTGTSRTRSWRSATTPNGRSLLASLRSRPKSSIRAVRSSSCSSTST